ncbi:hypothetical protein F4779DRAFT_622616 [Xylariaceae sp. FL0662B]|nr:hypothetical protein F4779DRAFT_622616 [Xylariaceae sp. FL0662B]
MRFSKSLLVLGLSPLATPAAPSGGGSDDDILTFTFGPASGANGTLAIHRAAALEYVEHELSAGFSAIKTKNVDQKGPPPPFIPQLKGAYAFPNGSGVEGSMAWDMTATSAYDAGADTSLKVVTTSTKDQQSDCDECFGTCIALAVLPPAFLA